MKRGPKGDPNPQKGPLGDPGTLKGTHLGTVALNYFFAGGRGGLIVNTASAAGLVFNQVGNEFNLSICTPALAQTDSIK